MNCTAVRLTRMSFVALAASAAALAGCRMPSAADEAPIRVGTYNIRLSGGVSHVADAGTPNTWEQRKADLVANAHLKPDGADWDGSKADFVEEWGPRIDTYLAGSPMEGQGETFAKAAWKNHIDPRWSPAIARMESSSGLYCFESHNAWGWGDVAWGDWESAIRGHVSGLASGYGYTLTWDAAQTYCPPNASFWYSSVSSCMYEIWGSDSL